jgi:hypothetical protein
VIKDLAYSDTGAPTKWSSRVSHLGRKAYHPIVLRYQMYQRASATSWSMMGNRLKLFPFPPTRTEFARERCVPMSASGHSGVAAAPLPVSETEDSASAWRLRTRHA